LQYKTPFGARLFLRAGRPLDSVKIEGWIGHDRDGMMDALGWSISHVDEHAINRTSRTGTL